MCVFVSRLLPKLKMKQTCHMIFRISSQLPCFQNLREASSRLRIFLNSLVYVCVCVYLFVCFLPPVYTNDTDLIFGTHTPIDLI